jgi:hypothetical protein
MSTWLEVPANRATFEEYRFAYITLMKEGVSKVTTPYMEARVKLLRWMWGATCVHPTSRTVMPLTDIMREGCPYRPEDIANLTLVTIKTDKGNALGAFVPVNFHEKSTGAIARPQGIGPRHIAPTFSHVASDLEDDFALLKQDKPKEEATHAADPQASLDMCDVPTA